MFLPQRIMLKQHEMCLFLEINHSADKNGEWTQEILDDKDQNNKLGN